MNIDLEIILQEVIQIAKRAGEYIRHESLKFDRKNIEEKGINNLVSYVDKEAEKMIVQTLKFTMKEAGFITEEGTEKESESEYNWVIDPLDGTTNFMHGLPPYSVSIALLHKDNPLVGVIYEINSDSCFYAVKGGKAYCNHEEIHVSSVSKFKHGLYITGFPYDLFDEVSRFTQLFEHFMRHTHGIRRFGSAAVDLAYVAAGKSEGFFQKGLNIWDVAAGALIVKQAGGIVTDFNGGKEYLTSGEIVSGNPHVQPVMVKIIRDHWKKT